MDPEWRPRTVRRVLIFGGRGSTKKAGNPAVVSSALQTANSVFLSWTNPSSALYDYVNIERSIGGGGWSVVATPAKGNTSVVDTPGYSTDNAYRIYGVKTGWQVSDTFNFTTVRTTPNVPSPQNLLAANPGLIDFYYNGPGHANIANYNVQRSDDNGGSWGSNIVDGTGHVQWGSVGHGLNVRARVQTIDTFAQVSAWAAWGAAVTSINDTTGPSAPTPSIYNLARGFVEVQYQACSDSQSGLASSYIQASYNGGAWQTIYTVPGYLLGTTNTFQDNITSRGVRGQTASYRMVNYDNLSNSSISAASAAVWLCPQGTFYIYANASGTYLQAGSNTWRGYTDLISDYIGDVAFWFYGNQVYNLCHGWAPDSGSIYLIKYNQGADGGAHDLNLHNGVNYSGSPGVVPGLIGTAIAGPNLYNGDALDFALGAGPLASLALNTSSGMALIPSGGSGERHLYGVGQNSTSGRFAFTFA